MNRRKIGASIAILTLGLGIGGAVGAGTGDVLGTPTDPPPPPGSRTLVGPAPVRSTTCEGALLCAFLSSACERAGGTYTEWPSPDHGHPHGICTWPWE